MKITQGGYSHTWRIDRIPRHLYSEQKFLSIEQIMRKTQLIVLTKRTKIMNKDVMNFRHDHPELFWNLIFYMSNYGLPYDMFLPYKETETIKSIEKTFEKMNEHCIIDFGPDTNISKILGKRNK